MKTTTTLFTSSTRSASVALLVGTLLLTGCVIVRPGQIGLVQKMGKLRDEPVTHGVKAINPFTTRVLKFSTRITEYSATIQLPTSEGLEISANITLLYHLKQEAVRNIYLSFGTNYGKSLVLNALEAVSREGALHYTAHEIIDQREEIEHIIQNKLEKQIGGYGVVVDELMLRDVDLPTELQQSIERQLKQQQDLVTAKLEIERQRGEHLFKLEKDSLQGVADVQKQRRDLDFSIEQQRTDEAFAIEKQKMEADRSLIEAEAYKKSQELMNSVITDKMIKLKSLDVEREMFESPNTKLIITDGKTPITLRTPDGG